MERKIEEQIGEDLKKSGMFQQRILKLLSHSIITEVLTINK